MAKQLLLMVIPTSSANYVLQIGNHLRHLFIAFLFVVASNDASAHKAIAPTCAPPTNLLVTNITNTGATVSWTSGGATDFEYAVQQSATPPSSGTAISAITASVSGLLSSNNYYLHVRAKCGAEYSAWVTSAPFTTLDPAASVVTWNAYDTTNFGANPLNPISVDSRIIVGGLTRGAGVSADNSVTAAGNAWGGYKWLGSANQDVTFTLTPKTNYKLSLSSLQLTYRISSTGPTNGTLSYSFDNGNTYTSIASLTFTSGSSGYDIQQIDLSGITALQNITAATVKFQILPSGGGATGTWYVYRQGLTVKGILTSTVTAPIVTTPFINPGCFTSSWSAISGATKYIVSVSTPGFSVVKDSTPIDGYDFSTSINSNLGLIGNYPSGNMNIPIATNAANTPTWTSDSSARATGWDGGSNSKNWEIYFQTTNYYNIKLSSIQRSSATGPKNFKLQYKIGSTGTYIDVPSGTIVLADDTITGVLKNIVLPSACDNQPQVYLRWIMTSNINVNNGSVSSLGASNIRNIKINGYLGRNFAYLSSYEKDTVASTPTSLQITGLSPNTVYNVNVRSIVSGVTSDASTTVSVTTATSSTADYRTAKTSGVWSDASTWEYDQGCGQSWVAATAPPGVDNNIIIQNTHAVTLDVNVTLNAGKTITIQPTGVLALNDKTFTLNGTLSGTGSFLGSASSSLVFNGSGSASINFLQTVQGASNALANLTVTSGNVTLGNKLHVYKLLDVSGGTLNLAAQQLVLKSTAVETARVAEIKGTLSGATNVMVERYIPNLGSRRWRLLTSPVTGTTINASWQEGATWNGGTAETGTGYGTLITGNQQGTSGNANGNGFDFWSATANTLASVRYYLGAPVNTAATWAPLTKTTTAGFDAAQAYLLFVRGDRSISSGTSVTATTLRATGTLRQGTTSATVIGSSTQSHTLIGNPYASPLDFYSLYSDPANSGKIKNQFWLFAANLSTFGAYKLVVEDGTNSGKYEALPEPFMPTTGIGTTDTRLIHSGSGFFVEPLLSSNKTLTILESHKTSGTPSQSVFREGDKPITLHKFYINLSELRPASGDTLLLDGALIRFGASGQNGEDIRKAVNTSENLSVWKERNDLIVTANRFPTAGDSLLLRIWNTVAGKTYLFQTKGLHLSDLNLQAYLVDKYTGTETALSLNGDVSTAKFSITGDAASKDPFRFSIVFKPVNTLPVTIAVLRAYFNADQTVGVEWKTENEIGMQGYEVEKSADGINFQKMSFVKAKGGATQSYACTDWQPSPVNYYRLKMVATSGSEKYSAVVKISGKEKAQAIVLYPNPSDGRSFGLELINKPAGLYYLTINNMTGQTVMQQSFIHAGGNAVFIIAPQKTLAAGSYTSKLSTGKGSTETKTLYVVH